VTEKKRRTPTSGEAPSPERIKDPGAGLDRMREALRKILTVPKEAVINPHEEKREKAR